jgi:aspartyl-tRNA(Asn)/glutamyl-tRNA(Gln) amidotransferase subunit C
MVYMTNISKEEVEHVANLARLSLSEEEIAKFGEQMGAILEHASAVSKIDTTGVIPTSHPIKMENVLRDDVVGESLTQEQALSGAPQEQDRRFVVPQILDTEEN